MGRPKGLGRVVVVGNSFAGLLTAAVLADHADQVTIVDRDRIPDNPQHRPGVPQGRHIHVLLLAGQRSIEALLPGILAQLDELGAPTVRVPEDTVMTTRGRWLRRIGPSLDLLTARRPLLEHVVRERVLANPRITTIDATEVVGLMGDHRQVRGVLVQRRGTGARPVPEELPADLVVDASGRGSHTPDWLTGIGAKPPAEEHIDSRLCYSTRAYQAPVHPGYKGIYLIPYPESTRGAVILPVEEKGEFLVTLSGLAGDEPPTDPHEFESYAKQLPQSIVYEWIMAAQPHGPPMGFHSTANVRRRYDRLGGRPRGLLVVGDAACAFNPVYGQGISVAAVAALALREALARGTRSTKRLQRIVLKAAVPAWMISSGADKRMPGAIGNAVKPGPADRFIDWYLARVEAHAADNVVVGTRFREVLNLVAPSSAIFAWPVLRTVLFGRLKPTPTEPPLYRESHGAYQPSHAAR